MTRPIIAILFLGVLLSLVWLIRKGCDSSLGNVPIALYGRVVDQDGKPLEDAYVTAQISRREFQAPVLWARGGSSRKVVEAYTDADGRFQFTGEQGNLIQSLVVAKNGYRSARDNPGGFIYDPGRTDSYHPDPMNPVIFEMSKIQDKEMDKGTFNISSR